MASEGKGSSGVGFLRLWQGFSLRREYTCPTSPSPGLLFLLLARHSTFHVSTTFHRAFLSLRPQCRERAHILYLKPYLGRTSGQLAEGKAYIWSGCSQNVFCGTLVP